MTGVSLVLHY